MSNEPNLNDDNLIAAMNHVAENLNPVVTPLEKIDDTPADKQVLIRTTEYDRNRWKDASIHSGVTLSAWIRETLNKESTTLLDCPHPTHQMRFYPWATMCLECGKRFSQTG